MFLRCGQLTKSCQSIVCHCQSIFFFKLNQTATVQWSVCHYYYYFNRACFSKMDVRQWRTGRAVGSWTGLWRLHWWTKTHFCQCLFRLFFFFKFPVIRLQIGHLSAIDWLTFHQYWRNPHYVPAVRNINNNNTFHLQAYTPMAILATKIKTNNYSKSFFPQITESICSPQK